jgi:nucleoside-diphosphate-sugar epimerase
VSFKFLQETLTANFEGTRTVLGLAAAAGDHLKALVHVSSAFVNMNQPCSSTIDEQLYPLRYGKQVADVELLAQVSTAGNLFLLLLTTWHMAHL